MLSSRIAAAHAQSADNTVWGVYNKIFIGLGMMVVMIIIMWYLNITGNKHLNIYFSFLAIFPVAYVLMQPRIQMYMAAAGATLGVISRVDTVAATGAAVGFWNILVLTIILWYLVICALLTTWSFAENPIAFWIIMFSALTLALLGVVTGITSWNRIVSILTIYIFGAIILALFSTFSPNTREKVADIVPDRIECFFDSSVSSCPTKKREGENNALAPTVSIDNTRVILNARTDGGMETSPFVVGKKTVTIPIANQQCIHIGRNGRHVKLVGTEGEYNDTFEAYYRSASGKPVKITVIYYPFSHDKCDHLRA